MILNTLRITLVLVAKQKAKLGTVKTLLRNVKQLNGTRYNINITIENHGGEASENPAYYGSLLEKGLDKGSKLGRDYRFISPSLQDFHKRVIKDTDTKYFLEIVKADGRKRGEKEMLKACKFYGQKAVERVQEYMLYEAHQYPERERKNPSLIDTGRLFDSIKYVVRDKKGRIRAGGR